jgi:hypothetical protein
LDSRRYLHKGILSLVPATHRKFETVSVNIFHFEENGIKEACTVVRGLGASLQFGAVRTICYESD